MVRRIFAEKKPGFDIEAKGLCTELKNNLGLDSIESLRIFNRYDVSGISEADFKKASVSIFSEPQLDNVYFENMPSLGTAFVFGHEYLKGQYDQRADSAMQCLALMGAGDMANVRFARIIAINAKIDLNDETRNKILSYIINPVDSMQASLDKPESLEGTAVEPEKIKTITGFGDFDFEKVGAFHKENGFAMSREDLAFVQEYFKSEDRDPTITELKVIDTYWSDHCRHTTFNTKLENISFPDSEYGRLLEAAFKNYLGQRELVYGDAAKTRDISLMDMGTISAKYQKKLGNLEDLDISEEINACSVKVNVDIERDGKLTEEEWLFMCKNETHNHPTERDPFGGAATCLGGAIRDPLSGRSYVYQAMRVTGAADPRTPFSDTIPGKLSQYQITKGAARGYSSYGNQIGLATGLVDEIYHKDYVAKRLEIGAVVGAVPAAAVRRERPAPGDKVLLIGGRTGRDGIGGATGSSKEHDEKSTALSGAEVQKGNPLVERALQRLFRREVASALIKRCNDFGAGGVCVAIGELADSLDIDLSLVPKKYEGLDGTELAISESQERMAVVVAAEDVEKMVDLGAEENLEVTPVATITDTGRMRMYWQEDLIVDLGRSFLDTNGVVQKRDVEVEDVDVSKLTCQTVTALASPLEQLASLNICSKKGMIDCFDSTIGAASVLLPLGGKSQLTPACGMASKLPLTEGETDAATLMTYGFDPDLSSISPYHGALYAVLSSVSKIVAMGGDASTVRLTFQEYFKKLGSSSTRWGEPFSALLGAITAQTGLGVAAIGGKDSMSGTYLDIDVPPTLVSFALSVSKASKTISPEFKNSKSKIVLIRTPINCKFIPDFDIFRKNAKRIFNLASKGKIRSASVIEKGGLFASLAKSALGNNIGCRVELAKDIDLHSPMYGSFILEVSEFIDLDTTFNDIDFKIIGETSDEKYIRIGENKFSLEELKKAYTSGLEGVFPTIVPIESDIETTTISAKVREPKIKTANIISGKNPRVVIPVFPGTNCEVDSKRAFERAGAEVELVNICNLNAQFLGESILSLKQAITNANIIMLAGGFSGGDEPEGSAKFINAIFRNESIENEVASLLEKRDGLMLGVCNGFQALIKLGLVPYGKIITTREEDPTLTFNNIGRHMSTIVKTRIATNNSPWLQNTNIGDEFFVPVSHGEGRFVANASTVKALTENAQIATQYVDENGNASMDITHNPNGSIGAIEGILSKDGRVFGKMGHIERIGEGLYRNFKGNFDAKIFEAGVSYFK
jgi:phosphoribosylformylglycinamidine synthase